MQDFLENSNENTSKQALLQPGNRKCRFYVPNQNSGEGRKSLVIWGGWTTLQTKQGEVCVLVFGRDRRPWVSGGKFRKFSLIVHITGNLRTSVDLSSQYETMHATTMRTIITYLENNVSISLLLENRGAVKTDRKWNCKRIYIHLEDLYWSKIFSKNVRKIGINFRRKFPYLQPYPWRKHHQNHRTKPRLFQVYFKPKIETVMKTDDSKC